MAWLITIQPVIVVLFLIGLIVRNIVAAWLDHRVKLALLAKLEAKPELIRSYDELQDLLDTSPSVEQLRKRQDYVLTGAMLAAIGLLFVIANAAVGSSTYATGAYFGGVACIVLGFILALLGLLIRYLRKTPLENDLSFQERIARLVRRNGPPD